ERTKEVRDIWPFFRDRRVEDYSCLLKRYCH
ncbi:MAG: carbon-nitrogen hydrolase, partial [Epsilonproteobacteria bacterium]|nr:carbon-nitrogen hydrolase [Campylobacterota bacterium]